MSVRSDRVSPCEYKGMSHPLPQWYAVGLSGSILKTTDGGADWAVQASGMGNGLHSVDFPSGPSSGYAVGDDGTVLVTTDGGTWVEDARTRGPERERRNLAVPNPFVS